MGPPVNAERLIFRWQDTLKLWPLSECASFKQRHQAVKEVCVFRYQRTEGRKMWKVRIGELKVVDWMTGDMVGDMRKMKQSFLTAFKGGIHKGRSEEVAEMIFEKRKVWEEKSGLKLRVVDLVLGRDKN